MSKLIKRLVAVSGGDINILEAPLIGILHERNKRLRNLGRSCGLRYRGGKFFLLPRDTYTVKQDELMRDLLVFAAFHELNLVLTTAFRFAETEAETNGSVSVLLEDSEESFRVEVINVNFLCDCVIAVVEQFSKVTCPALIARTLDVIDNEKAIYFLCG